ncbi:unnamed protein product [Euphydryas editha]|uniref:Uncharacterized protein n=1 Tax=Euphydryas editha TaxID=104508 RepID=A0AAU9ULW7_EUPED|nr:unnamed protein product [Euphydryas editha]
MTSTNDGKDVKSNQTSGQKGKTYYIELFKSLEARLSAECTGEQRTRLVCEAWRRVHSLSQHSAPNTHPLLLNWLQQHTSHTILQSEWQSPKSKDQHTWLEEAINTFIEECQVTRDAPSWESQLLHRAQWFKTILSNPWGHPVLKALLDSRGTQPTHNEVLEWLKEERAAMFVTRLRQLAASKCDDLALLLASAVMSLARDCTTVLSDIEQAADLKDVTEQPEASKSELSFVDILSKEADFTADVWELLTDIEFVLLHKGQSRSRCIELAKQTPLRNGYQLVERLHRRLEMSPRDKKLWKNAKDVATLIAQVVIARCMVVPTCSGIAKVALYGCARSLVRLLPVDKLPTVAAALAAPAATSRHLHMLAKAVHEECKDERKSFVCELYVRAITAGMNELERLKLKTEKESEARLTEETLSTWFIQLGTLLSASSRMNCECVLTAFSVHPSPFMYEEIKAAPPLTPIHKDIQEPRLETNSEFGSWATDSRTQTNLVKTSETLNLKQTQKQANVLSTAIFAEGEALGLGAELCQDLASLISGPRVKTLSWDMDRELLLENCRTYMERTHGGTRALMTELKYLNLDPRSFQHLPEEVDNENDAFYGIEKGYEHLVEFQEPEEIWQDALLDEKEKSDSAHSIEELPIVIPRRKKKSKKLKYSSDETDPLSFGDHAESSEKKERPHSKERSKERKQRKDKNKIKEEPTKETEQSIEQGQLITEKINDVRKKEKKKERKERKKREKTEKKQSVTKQQKPPQSGPLSRLVGMKVARISDINKQLKKSEPDTNVVNNLCITDSDYDSQGKSSINSEGNDTDVLFDGLFSMDEIKSPEKSTIENTQRTNTIPNIEELRVSNGIIVNNSLGVPAMSLHATQTQNIQPNVNPNPMCTVQTNANNDVREEVKRSIKKLIEFRRNKNSSEVSTKLDAPILKSNFVPHKPASENETDFNIPKVYLNKKAVKQLNALKDEVDIILRNCGNKGNFIKHSTVRNEPLKLNNTTNKMNHEQTIDKVINRDNVQASSSVRNYQQPLNKTTDPSDLKTSKASLIRNIESPSQIQYKEFLKQKSHNTIKKHHKVSNVIDTSSQKQSQNVREPPKQVANSRPKLNNLNLTPEIIQRDFTKQPLTIKSQILQTDSDNINVPDLSLVKPRQSSTKCLQNVPCQSITNVTVTPLLPTQNHFESFLRELQETINAGASKEKPETKLPVSDKNNYPKQIIQQKKVDNAPNTFSRLSYLHKNKQNDGKNKVTVDQIKPLPNSSTVDKPNLGFNIDKVNHLLQSKSEIVISRIDKPKIDSNDNTKLIVQKTQNFKCSPSIKTNPSCLNNQYPMISNMLMSKSKSYSVKAPNDNENRNIQQKNTVTPITHSITSSYPSEKDHHDLLLLLRQQSKMNSLRKQHKTETPKTNTNNSSTMDTSIKSTVKSNNNDIHPKESHNANEMVPNLGISNTLTDLSSLVKVPDKKSSLSEPKKGRNIKGCTKNPKQTVKSNETSDWESVMNALLAQKTPSRGPNALDIALKKNSFGKRPSNNLENQSIKTTFTRNDVTFEHSKTTSIDNVNLKKCPIKSNSPAVSSGNTIMSNTHAIQPQLKQKQEKKISCKNKNIELGKNSPLDLIEKRFTDVIQNTNDPFISGIPNSDYDLLEELMDDDLRKEIGELMSDEEAYGTLVQTSKSKNALNDKPTNSFLNKHPNQKMNSITTRKTATADSCQKLDLFQNKNIILPPELTKDVSLKCNKLSKPVLQMKSNTSTRNSDNANKKSRIISNELITSPIISQLKLSNNVQQLKTLTPENNSLNTNVVRNTMATSSIRPSVCIKSKIDDLPVKEIQKTNTENLLNNKNIVLDQTRVILTVPQRNVTPNVMLIGNELICDAFSTVKTDQSNRNTYVSVNQAPNLTLYSTTQFVAPCVNPVVIEHSSTLPVVQTVSPNISMILSSNTPLKSINSETENNSMYSKFQEENKVKAGNCHGSELKLEVPNSKSENSENNIVASNIFCGTPENNKNPVCPNIVENSTDLTCDMLKVKNESSNQKILSDSVLSKRHNTKLSTKEVPNSKSENSENNIVASNIFCGTPENNKNPVCPNSVENSTDLTCDMLKVKNESSNQKILSDSVQSKRHNTKLSTKELTQVSKIDSDFNAMQEISEKNKSFKLEKKIEKEIPNEQEKPSFLGPVSELKTCQENNQVVKTKYEKEERDRLQNKRMQIINRQNKHHIYDKPIALSFKSKISTDEVLKSNEKQEDNLLKNNIRENKKMSSENIDHHKNDDEKTNTNKKETPQENENLNICENLCQKLSGSSINENSAVSPSRRISLRPPNVLNDSTILMSPKRKTVGMKPKVRPKSQSLLKKRLPILKPVVTKALKKIPVKSKIIKSPKQFEKQIKHKIKLKKINVSNLETEVNTTQSNIDNTSLDRTIEKMNYTCVDIEEQITSAIIPNIFKEKRNNKNMSENELSTTEYLSAHMDKDAIESNLQGHVQTTTKIMKPLNNGKEKSVEKKECEVNTIDTNKNKLCSVNKDVTGVTEKTICVKDVSKKSEKLHQTIDKPNENSEIQTGILCNESNSYQSITHEKILQYKDKVILEEIPNNNNDPLKKIVRIKLPNGNTFKATISGKLNMNVDSLFEDPTIKSLLWKNINNNTKCTLNIKQIAIKTANKCETVLTKVHDISYVRSPVVNAETINLISDDEDSVQTFKTEFGNYDIAFMNPDLFYQHQKRLSQKCTVRLERCPTLSKIANQGHLTKLYEDDKDINCYTSLQPTSLQENETDFIEIDDSSNESEITNIVPSADYDIIKLTENFDEEVDKNKLKNDFVQVAVDNVLQKNITTDGNDEEKSKQCLLRIEKCDELVKKMEIQKNMCFVSLVRCDDTLKNHEKNSHLLSNCSNSKEKSEYVRDSLEESLSLSDEHCNRGSTLKRSESLSILSDFMVSDGSKSIQGSPQTGNHESLSIISTLFGVLPQTFHKCNADWLMTKCDLHHYHKNAHPRSETEDENMKYDDTSTDCDSDIEICTHTCVPNIEEDNTCIPEQIKYEVPSLVKLIVNYFVNNSNLIENLRSIPHNADIQPIASSSPLKRKLMDVVDNKNRSKVLKIDNFLPELQSSDDTVAISSHNEKDPLEESLSFMEIVEDTEFQHYDVIVNSEGIDENMLKSNDEILTSNEKNKKVNSTTFDDEVIISSHELNVDECSNDSVLNISNISCGKNSSQCFQKVMETCLTVNEPTQIELSNKKPDEQIECHIESKLTSFFTDNGIETRIDLTNCPADEDKIEVIIPLEKIDDENIQSSPLNSTNLRYSCLSEEPSSDKIIETNLNKYEVNNFQECDLNTNINVKKEEIFIKESDSNSVNKSNSETIISNKILDDIIQNKKSEILCDKDNLQKQKDQEYTLNENKGKECENMILENKNNDVIIDKELKQNIDIKQIYTKPSVDCKSLQNKLITKSLNDNALQKNVTLVYKGESNVVLKGSIYEDPVVGTCYVFPILNKTSYDGEITCSNICDEKTINVIQALKNKVFEDQNDECNEKDNSNNFDVVVPKITYSRQRISDTKQNAEKIKRKTLKRKSEASDNKLNEKRYRKGKNIDYPKITVTAMTESAYSKEYKRLINYCSSIKFSFSRPFHKEYIDVSSVLKCWPIRETTNHICDLADDKSVLFLDENIEKEGPYDPLQQTLAEEISSNYVERQSSCDQINENNFSMGFGEGSGRVINISEDGDNISKFSAATLSDVKQSQPFLLSEDYEDYDKCGEICKFNKDQFDIFKRYVSYIQLRDKVRSFFKKTTLELNYHWLKDNIKNKYKMSVYNNKSKNDFPYELVSPDFIEPAPVEAVVQVVQVGQLPVSAAAQNPVTCDPRVTQVTDASPSQCSVENSPQDDSQSPIKTEYTELTTADLSLPIVQEYERHMKSQESSKVPICNENIPVEMEVTEEAKHEELPNIKNEPNDYNDNDDLQSLVNKHINNVEYSYDSNGNNSSLEGQSNNDIFETLEKHNAEFIAQQKQQNGSAEKTDQIAHAMNAAGITTTPEIISNERGLVNIMSPKIGPDTNNQVPQSNNYPKPAINAMSLQQALAQILPPPLNQTNSQDNNQTATNSSATSQVLHIVQGKNTNGNQITLVDNTQNSVINNPNTPVLHIVQNKGVSNNSTSNANNGQHTASYAGLSLVETGLQQGNNQLLHIVNTGNQKSPATGQLLKRVNLLTNLSNVQGTNDQKMVQFLCKAADGKSIQLNASHQRSMVLRLQPIESSNIQVNQKTDTQDLSPSGNTNITPSNKECINAQHEIKSRSVYEENYAKFIQSSTNKSLPEKSTSLPKFNQAFGKQVFQDGNQKSNDINSNTSHLSSVTLNSESSECQPSDTALNLDHMRQINSPPLLLRKTTPQTTQAPSAQTNLMQQIKQTISPMNIQTMHGGVIYTRQIPVNIGGGQTINLITVPSTELIDENNQKPQNDVKFVNQNEIDSPIIKIVPQNQTPNTDSNSDESISHVPASNESSQNAPSQHQPVLTQMRIKLPMLSKAPQMVSGTRVVRPSFFQIQRNVIGGANQPVYQQLVLTAAPPLGQHTIRLPQTQTARQVKINPESQSSTESQMSSSTLEQLREFDMVLEQVKERSTVQPNTNVNNTYTKLNTSTSETIDTTSITSTVTESTQQVLYSIGSNQSVNVAYVSRKPNTTPPTQSAFVRSPDSSGIIESPSSSTQVQIPHTVTSETTSSESTTQPNQQKAAKVGSKSKSRPKSSHPPNSLKINTVPPKTSTQKPLEDEQTTQRILYILAEYKEQVENSPDKDKPAPRRRSNPPSNPSGSSKRKKSSSSSRRPGGRDMSPVHGDETCRTMGSEDSSCGTSQGDCNENCLETHSPQDSPRKIVRKLTFENETNRPRPQPQRNVIVADGQTITVARGTAGKPTTAVLMPANYILPVSMVKGGQQIAIVTNRGPKLLTVGGGEGGATNALLLQRLIGPAGLKPVLARPGVRHVRLPTAALHNLQAFNLATATTVQPPDSTASPAPAPTPPELIETRAASSPWTDRESQDVKPERGSSPEDSEPWNLPSSADPHDYTYEETVRTDNMDRTVLDAIPDRYSPEMEAQRIFDKMFDVDSKRSYIVDSQDDTSRCAYDIDASDSDDKAYHQVVHRKDGSSHRQHRLTHVSAAALRHKYAILEHELRLQKSLSEECEDLGVDSPSASELFPEAELLFAASPAHDAPQHSHTPQPTILNQSGIPQPDIDDQIATDRLLHQDVTDDQQDLGVTLGLDEGIVTVSEDGMQATIALDQEEFARSHPNTTFHSEPTDEGEVQPFTITGLKGRHITSTIFHAGRAPATVLVTAPQTTVISQATPDNANNANNNLKFANINQIINSSSVTHGNLNLSSVLVKDDGLTKFDSILTDSRELHLSNTASAIVHSTGNATQVIRRVCYEEDKRDTRFLMDEPEALIAGDDAKMIAEDSSRDATLESIAGDVDDDNSSPERHAELFWESNSERSESRRPLESSSDSEKCCKSPSYDETNSTDSSGVGTHMRLDSVIKDARGIERSGSADGSSADDTHPPLRTYPAKRMYHTIDGEIERSMSGKTRAGFQEERSESLEVRRRASNRGVVKRGCHCCNGSPAPPKPKKPRQKKPTMDFTSN